MATCITISTVAQQIEPNTQQLSMFEQTKNEGDVDVIQRGEPD